MLIVLYQQLAASLVDRCQTLIYGAPRGAPRGSKDLLLTSATVSFNFSHSGNRFINELLLFAPAVYSYIRACDAAFCQQNLLSRGILGIRSSKAQKQIKSSQTPLP